MLYIGRDLCRSSHPTPLLKHSHLQRLTRTMSKWLHKGNQKQVLGDEGCRESGWRKRGWEERMYLPAQGRIFSGSHSTNHRQAMLNYLLLPSLGQVQLEKAALKWHWLSLCCHSSNFLSKWRQCSHRAACRGLRMYRTCYSPRAEGGEASSWLHSPPSHLCREEAERHIHTPRALGLLKTLTCLFQRRSAQNCAAAPPP